MGDIVNTTIDVKEDAYQTVNSDYISEQDKRQADILLETTNIVEEIDEDELDKIGNWVVDIYKEDLDSRSEWENNNDKWLKLANQLMESKNYPWHGASNVKYPLLSVAATQFHARAYSALIPDERVVKTRILGADPRGEKAASAERVSKHMSYQVLHEMEDWPEDLDRGMYVLPIVGLIYKKSYYSPVEGTNVSEVCLPDDVVVNYYAKNLKRAIKTHRLYQDANEVKELMNLGHYREVELQGPDTNPHEGVEDQLTGLSEPARSTNGGPVIDDEEDGNRYSDVPYTILESHTWWDLDGDGYKEPYIITVEEDSRKVLRIVARWRSENVQYTADGEVLKIIPTEYFTLFGFLPNPESKIYYQGFGQLLGPLNAAANTLMNQLIDAGTLANMPGGFLGRGMKLRGGQLKFSPGKWQQIPVQGDDIRKNVFPLPYKEPSTVLFQLLGLVIESGERLSSVKDLMMGENPGQNQPYSTSVMVLEQGMKVFSGIYRRLYRAMGREFKKLFHLNRLYLDQEKYFMLMDEEELRSVRANDYNITEMDIIPGADPNIVSEAHKVMKANSLLQKKAAGLPLNTQMVTRAVLEAEGHDDIDKLMQVEPPQEDPKIVLERQKLQLEHQRALMEMQMTAAQKEYESFKDYSQAIAHLAKAQSAVDSSEREDFKLIADKMMEDYKAVTERMKALQESVQKQQKGEEEEEVPQQGQQTRITEKVVPKGNF